MKTQQTNRLIAEFITDEPEVLKHDLKKAGCVESMHYHDSWDWLMPVVRKIVEICIENDDLFLSDQYTSILETVPLAIIEDTYKVVVEFLKFYNEDKNN